ncbi:MAG: methyltransferase domain-containing protein [Candidatus Heimdallarchaeota archaeon]|nr:methyltransferase domain-containing protein [Candidatus Heimdallarchaeota archaeon]
MNKQGLYHELAKYYDYIYSKKDYQTEVQKLEEIIEKYKTSSGKELLDVACGTGSHLKYFVKKFNCTGVDINPEMLKVAKNKVPQVKFIESDMSELNLNKKFDVIVCLFSSIGYLATEEKLTKAIQGFSNSLKEGGIVIIEPWLTKENYRVGSPHLTVYDGKNLKIARANVSMLKENNISYFDMHYLIVEKDKEVKYFVDHHELALFPIELLIEQMEKYGLRTSFFKEEVFSDRGLCVGRKE